MSYKTSDQLINEAASDIGALGPGEALSAEDKAILQAKLDGLIDQLNAEEGVYIGDTEQIPDSMFLTLARLLGNVAGAALVGSPFNDDAWQRDIKTLRRVIAVAPSYAPSQGHYF